MIKIGNLHLRYKNRDEQAIDNINLHIKKGERVVIIGSSGSGKSTLLKCINRLVEPTNGTIHIGGDEILACPIHKAVSIRGRVGMVFQNYNLLERETVFKNVLNGRLRFNKSFSTILGMFSSEDRTVVKENIIAVGLEKYENQPVSNLSGGQKQRVAIARALSQKPEVILADEPVSNLDPKLMREIMDLLQKICIDKSITLVTCLHFLEFAKRYGSRILGMRNGRIVFEGEPADLTRKAIADIYGRTERWSLHGRTGF